MHAASPCGAAAGPAGWPQGLLEVIPLHHSTILGHEQARLPDGLDAFGDPLELQACTQRINRADDGRVVVVVRGVPDKGRIDRDLIDRESSRLAKQIHTQHSRTRPP